MKEKAQSLIIFLGTIVVGMMLIVMYKQDKQLMEYQDIINNMDTLTVVERDTLYETKTVTDTVPKYITKTITKRDTIYKDSTQHILTLESKTFENTLTQDGDTTTYKAYVSGYNLDFQPYPKLDSINLHTSHRIINTNTTTTQVIKVPQKQKLITTSPSIMLGYDPINKQWGTMLGISLNLNLW
jgi:hypothetical protein